AEDVVKKKLAGEADRVIMNLPEKAVQFVGAACEALKPKGGIIHFYTFVNSSKTLEEAKVTFVHEVEESGRKVKDTLSSRRVRSTAPYEWQAVLDA
ncbi:MAG: tRNA (guanine-N1)-methyltransferase, partial [Candidatus Thorarchaeota archaeon]|nr:tRNA (guanine-N1)-methyltransferase [Candidatus Thorarchaeota archaeon]